MTEFLSDEWIHALDARLGEAERGTSPTPLVVQYLVTTSSGEREYWLELGPERDRAHSGRTDRADVTFTLEYDTALAITAGELSTEEAFITGRLSLEGDTIAMIDAYRDATGA